MSIVLLLVDTDILVITNPAVGQQRRATQLCSLFNDIYLYSSDHITVNIQHTVDSKWPEIYHAIIHHALSILFSSNQCTTSY